jgi:hypothetical protein
MIGEPPSALEMTEIPMIANVGKIKGSDSVEDFGTEIRNLYLPTLAKEGLVKEDGGADPMKVILKEKLDERGSGPGGQGPGSLLMEGISIAILSLRSNLTVIVFLQFLISRLRPNTRQTLYFSRNDWKTSSCLL